MVDKLKSFAHIIVISLSVGIILFTLGRNAARRELELNRLRDSARRLETRHEINENVNRESDLVRRAVESGVVRKSP